MDRTRLIIVGAGGLGREVAAMIMGSTLGDGLQVHGFVDDNKSQGSRIGNLEVLGSVEWLLESGQETAITIAIGDPLTRKRIYCQLQKNRHISFPNIIHPTARIHDPARVTMGQGNIIADGNILTTDISLGDCNFINLSCTIGHDAEIGSYCAIMPGVHISGGTKLDDGVYLGTGCKLIKATKLGEYCKIGAGAVVNSDIPANCTAVGVPARIL